MKMLKLMTLTLALSSGVFASDAAPKASGQLNGKEVDCKEFSDLSRTMNIKNQKTDENNVPVLETITGNNTPQLLNS